MFADTWPCRISDSDISGLGTHCFHPVPPRDYSGLLGITWES